MSDAFVPGYHLRPILKGTLGEPSKIREELDEFVEAQEQGVAIMAMVELADLHGAFEAVLAKHFPDLSVSDVARWAQDHPQPGDLATLRAALADLTAAVTHQEPGAEMALVTLYAALAAVLDDSFPWLTLNDLARMASVTRRAFQNGRRT